MRLANPLAKIGGLVATLTGRLSSMVVVFVVFGLLARRLSPEDYGTFVLAFGVAATLYFAIGMGIPDGSVRLGVEATQAGRDAYLAGVLNAAWRANYWTGAVGAGAVISALLVWSGRPWIAATAAWVFCWALLFSSAQMHVALGLERLGGFLFYSAGSISLLAFVVPYATWCEIPTAAGAIGFASLGYGTVSAVGLASARHRMRALPSPGSTVPITTVFLVGWPFATTRVVQTAFIWSVPWAVGLASGVAEAGLVGTGVRVANALGAPLAVLRFVYRPRLIRLYAMGEVRKIRRLLYAVSLAAGVAGLLLSTVAVLGGDRFLGEVFGARFAQSSTVLIIGLVAMSGDGFVGLWDEIVRIGRRPYFVLTIQMLFSVFAVMIIVIVARGNTIAAMLTYASYYFLFAIIMFVAARRTLRELQASSDTLTVRDPSAAATQAAVASQDRP